MLLVIGSRSCGHLFCLWVGVNTARFSETFSTTAITWREKKWGWASIKNFNPINWHPLFIFYLFFFSFAEYVTNGAIYNFNYKSTSICWAVQFKDTHTRRLLLQLLEARKFVDILRQQRPPLIVHNSLCLAKRTLAWHWSGRDTCKLLHLSGFTSLALTVYFRLIFHRKYALHIGVLIHICMVKAFNFYFWSVKILLINRLKKLIVIKALNGRLINQLPSPRKKQCVFHIGYEH